jgi:hypothetical protein
VYRMATGHGGLTPADAVVATAMRALASWSVGADGADPSGLTLSPMLVLPAQVSESMTTGQPVVRVLVALPVPLDVSLVGGGGPRT